MPQLDHSRLSQISVIVIGSALLAISAKVQVPFWPVPMTMQTFVVLLMGAVLGWRLAGASVLAYLAQGAIGLPVFAGGAGLAYMAGPTGGYLAGFLLGAVAVGWLAEQGLGRTVTTTALAFLIGQVAIFGLGVAWLAGFIGLDKAIAAGLTPFLLAEAFKMALACTVLPLIWKAAARR
jgi:biotin transport system substrate-specific component